MKIYIAYKFANVVDKEKTKQDLYKISDLLTSMGHETFILGRDVKKWQHLKLSNIRMAPVIIKNLKNADVLLAYISSTAKSKGLNFELHTAKFINKPTKFIVTAAAEPSKYNNPLIINSINDLTEQKLQNLLN